MKIAITQPTFLPWQGYFALISHVDEVVFLDDVQFEKRSWQQRNKIKFLKKEIILTVPVISKNKFHQRINEVNIDSKASYIRKHKASILQNYSKAKYFNKYIKKISEIYERDFHLLFDLNISLINFFLEELNIKTKISFSSALGLSEKKQFLIDKICNIKKCTRYISTVGSENYLTLLDKNKLNYEIKYFDFKHLKYTQLGNEFIKNLSILDLLFNKGEDSIDYLNKNFFIL